MRQTERPIRNGGQKANAILTCIMRKFRTQNIDTSSEDVIQAENIVARSARLDFPRPADHERHAMPAFPDIRFSSAIRSAWQMASIDQDTPIRRQVTIVGGEYHQPT